MLRIALLVALASIVATSTATANPRHGRWHRERPFERVQAIANACSDAMTGRDNEQQCMTIVNRGRSRFAPAPMIEACEQAMTGDANALACLDAVAGTRYDARELVAFCERETVGDSATLACIRSWR